MRRVASIPFISGMLMSIRTSAGCSASTSSIASGPVDASPASSKQSIRRSTAWPAEGAATPAAGGSASLGVGQVEQHRLDPPVQVLLLAQPELGEDRVGVL